MRRTIAMLALAGGMMVAMTVAAAAQTPGSHPEKCSIPGTYKRDSYVAYLASKFSESRFGFGIWRGRGGRAVGVVEMYRAESGTWTAILTYPNGCVRPLSSGDAWTPEKLRKSKGSPA